MPGARGARAARGRHRRGGVECESADEDREAAQERPLVAGEQLVAPVDQRAQRLLARQPRDHRKILLLVSESRDHGSVHVNVPGLVQRIGETNTLVLSLIFSPARAELGYGWKHAGSGSGILGALLMAYNAMRKNVPKALVQMSGGEYADFSRDKRFQTGVVGLAIDS